ncbi:MAG: ATP-binding protein [Candidatus Nanohalobium sp.]
MRFFDREKELEALKKKYSSGSFELFILYGRRRVGKTELIKHFCQNKPHIYHLFSQDTEKRQRERLAASIADYFDEPEPKLEDWRETVEYIGEKLKQEKIILALDEFPYAIESNEPLASHFQYLVDEILRENSESMVILSGSTVSVMLDDVLGYESPLYGRRTGQIDLKPFRFAESLKVINYSIEDAVRSYAVTGGTPMYLTSFDYSKRLEQNIRDEILNPSSALFEEPEFLLRQELRQPSRYAGILESIANGHTTLNEISNNTGISSGTMPQYLKRLQKLRLIERTTPVTSSQKTKRSIYQIKDNFIRFWYRNIHSQKSTVEENPDKASETIMNDLKHQAAETFEQICRETIQKSGEYTKIGKWWYREHEIDVVALDEQEKKILLGEAKWTNQEIGENLLRQLEEKTEKVRWKNKDRKVKYTLFSKNGFTQKLKQTAEQREDLKLYDLEKVEKSLKYTPQ